MKLSKKLSTGFKKEIIYQFEELYPSFEHTSIYNTYIKLFLKKVKTNILDWQNCFTIAWKQINFKSTKDSLQLPVDSGFKSVEVKIMDETDCNFLKISGLKYGHNDLDNLVCTSLEENQSWKINHKIPVS